MPKNCVGLIGTLPVKTIGFIGSSNEKSALELSPSLTISFSIIVQSKALPLINKVAGF